MFGSYKNVVTGFKTTLLYSDIVQNTFVLKTTSFST